MFPLHKNSFTLFEVLVSLVILSVVISGVSKLFVNDNANEIYYELQDIENQYIENNKIKSTENIKLRNF